MSRETQTVKEIYVNVGERETRIAVMEDSKLVEMHIERAERVVGSLYKCRVANVLQGMDAAFVDIGLERNAFLYVGDVLPGADDLMTAPTVAHPPVSSSSVPPIVTAPPPTPPGSPTPTIPIFEPTRPLASERRGKFGRGRRNAKIEEPPVPSTIPEIALVETDDIVVEALSVTEFEAEVDAILDDVEAMEADVDIELESSAPDASSGTPAPNRRPAPIRRSTLRNQKIKDVLKIGQELLVQVIKGPRSTKGARVSTRISLPGRYLVLMPENDMLGVSRKIEDVKERDRLKRIGDKLRIPGFGVIIRTEAEEKTEQELQSDMDFLVKTWRHIQETARNVHAPALVQADLTLLYKTIRDVFGSDVSKLVIDQPAEYERANELIETLSPKLKGRIHLYDGDAPIFDTYKIEDEFDKLTRRKVLMKSGGSLVIDETEALTVIDVNTSKFTGSNSLAETIIKTNMDAANEIARQLRLRDIGGIIVIDFIDMNNARDKALVIKTLETALKRDRSRTKISNISPLGLVEMTRKRTGETITGFLTDECPYCKGRGHLPTAESMSVLVERDLRRQALAANNAKREAFMILCHPEVAEILIGPDGATAAELERDIQKAIYIRADEDSHIERFSIHAGEIEQYEKQLMGYRRAQVVECIIAKSVLKEGNKCIAWSGGYLLDVEDGFKSIGQTAKARITDIRRSFAPAQLVPGTTKIG